MLVDKFDMPYQTLSALSSRIQFKYPDKMVKMTEELPIPSEESVKKNILFDVGQIYFNTSKAYFDLSNPDNAIKNANIAKQYFETMSFKNEYQKISTIVNHTESLFAKDELLSFIENEQNNDFKNNTNLK